MTAKEQTTGVEQKITVKPSHGLTDEEIEQMLLDSIDHAEEDIQQRLLAEQQVEAERMLVDAEKQLAQNGDLLERRRAPRSSSAAMARGGRSASRPRITRCSRRPSTRWTSRPSPSSSAS